MKIVFSFLMLCSLSLHAATDSNVTISLKDALTLYKAKKYQEAYDAFFSLIESDLASIEYNFYFGRAATELKNYDEAISAFERILINNPYNSRTKLELGRIYYLLGSFDYAKKYFKEVLRTEIPEAVRNNVNSYMAMMDRKKSYSSLTGMIMVGGYYDSNVYSASDAENYYVPLYGVNFTNTAKTQGDWAHQEVVVINQILDTTEDVGFAVKNDITLFSRSFDAHSDLNLLFMSYTPAASWKAGQTQWSVGFPLETVLIKNERYLETQGFLGKYTHMTQDKGIWSGYYKTTKKSYVKTSNQGRDSNFVELSLGYQSYASPLFSWNTKMILQSERKKSGTIANVDYNGAEVVAGVSQRFWGSYKADVTLSYKKLAYRDVDTSFKKKREDQRSMLSLALQKNLTKTWLIQMSAQAIKYDSNIVPFAYDKGTFTLNVIRQF